MRQAQGGSAGSVAILVVLVALAWWQWDWLSGLMGGKGAAVELVDYRCEGRSGGLTIEGRVRNASGEPLALRAVTAVYDSSGKKSDYVEAAIRPMPIPAGQEGSFRAEGPPLPDGGYCKLDNVVDADTRKPLRYSTRR
jgi:hypothetical protein